MDVSHHLDKWTRKVRAKTIQITIIWVYHGGGPDVVRGDGSVEEGDDDLLGDGCGEGGHLGDGLGGEGGGGRGGGRGGAGQPQGGEEAGEEREPGEVQQAALLLQRGGGGRGQA